MNMKTTQSFKLVTIIAILSAGMSMAAHAQIASRGASFGGGFGVHTATGGGFNATSAAVGIRNSIHSDNTAAVRGTTMGSGVVNGGILRGANSTNIGAKGAGDVGGSESSSSATKVNGHGNASANASGNSAIDVARNTSQAQAQAASAARGGVTEAGAKASSTVNSATATTAKVSDMAKASAYASASNATRTAGTVQAPDTQLGGAANLGATARGNSSTGLNR
jgi:hypothetical protein